MEVTDATWAAAASAATCGTLRLTVRAALGRRSLLGVADIRRGSQTLSEAQSTRTSSSVNQEEVRARPVQLGDRHVGPGVDRQVLRAS